MLADALSVQVSFCLCLCYLKSLYHLLFSSRRHVIHRNRPGNTLHTHKASTRIRYSLQSSCPPAALCPAPLSALSLNLTFNFSVGLRERGHTRETTADGREGGEWRGDPRDAQAEEPSALLSLPNQTRAGAAGTGLLSLRSVHHTRVALRAHVGSTKHSPLILISLTSVPAVEENMLTKSGPAAFLSDLKN